MSNIKSSARTRAPRVLRAVMMAATLASGAACSSGDSTGPAKATLAAGTYDMRVVGPNPVPFVIQDGPLEWDGVKYNQLFVRVDGGFIELREDHTFHVVIDIFIDSDPGGTEQGVYERTGRYSVVDDRIELDIQQPSKGSWSGQWAGDRVGFNVTFLGQPDEWFIGFELTRK